MSSTSEEKVARVIASEIPLGRVNTFLRQLERSPEVENGNGCGGGCGGNCGLAIDEFGILLTPKDLEQVKGNIQSVRGALADQATAKLKTFRG